jgi:8-amino-7-oxononanoate synthase
MADQNRYETELGLLKAGGNLRALPVHCNSDMIDLSTNDYLGLSSNCQLYEEFLGTFMSTKFKFGSSSSRLLSGNTVGYNTLEELIANSYKKEACLVYNSGYHANTGVIQALGGKKDLIVTDKLVHASIIDGARLSNAKLMRYKHLDYNHLELILKKNRKSYENVIIISETIFSMDGDIANIEMLIDLRNKYNCLLYIDEAHAVGVRGRKGLGCAEEFNVFDNIDIIVGTFGKALASVGAYVVCSYLHKNYLINTSRSLIYTTALPPVNLAWTEFVFSRLPDFIDNRNKLSNLSCEFSSMIGVRPESHIVPFLVGENNEAVDISLELNQKGFNVLPIRYPTVPKGTARLRFSMAANFKINQLTAIKEVLDKFTHKERNQISIDL